MKRNQPPKIPQLFTKLFKSVKHNESSRRRFISSISEIPMWFSKMKSCVKDTKTRILICYLGLMIAFVISSIPLFYHLLLSNVNQRVTEDVEESLGAFEEFLEREQSNNDTLDQDRLKQLFTDYLNYYIPEDDTFLITIVEGKFYDASSHALPNIIGIRSVFMRKWSKLEQPIKGEQKTDNPEIGSVVYQTKPFIEQNKVLGTLVVVHTTAGEIQEVIDAIFVMAQVLIIILFFSMISAWFLSARILSPLRVLSATARRISESDLNKRVPPQGTGELAELALTFNAMMERLEKAFTSQRELLNNVSHELRTPITIIQGNLELMGDEPQEREETLSIVFEELQRMTRIINDLILLVKLERPDFLHLHPIDVSLFTQELFEKMSTLGERNWHLVNVAQGSIIGDHQRLAQGILNLAENAVKFTTENDFIEFGSEIKNQKIRFWVKDTGSGIAKEDQLQIFERFVQGGKNEYSSQGLGLGLSIVQAIAEAHHGTVRLVSQLGKGSTFTLVLPLKEDRRQKATPL